MWSWESISKLREREMGKEKKQTNKKNSNIQKSIVTFNGNVSVMPTAQSLKRIQIGNTLLY